MNFEIISIDNINKTMVINWGNDIVLNHYIPTEILENANISKDAAAEIIEQLRPVVPEPIDIPSALNELYKDTHDRYIDNSDNEEII